MHVLKYLPAASVLSSTYAATTTFCKRGPASPQWPSQQQWQALNATVNGALQVPTAPAAVCHPDQPNFNNQTCAAVLANWTSTEWVASNSWLADYNDDTCLPSAAAPCSTAGYPAYVIEANNGNDVAAGIRFAKANQVRLIVKGTGHDFPGRSSGPGSLSIWTHKLQGIQFSMNDAKAVKYGGVAAVKIAAGMRWGEVYTEAVKHNLTVIGGGDLNVGVGGWHTGGGHSPISAKYGLGADQILEMEVVTADGQILTINEICHADLFWSMRGGGGSTFAVLLSVTVKAYPSISVTVYSFLYNTTVNSDTFWLAVARLHADLPRIANAGGMGYYYITPGGLLPGEPQGQIAGAWIFPQQSEQQVRAIMAPLEDSLNNATWADDRIYAGGMTNSAQDFTAAWLALNQPQRGGSSARMGSWLFDGPSLTSNMTNMAAEFKKICPLPNSLLGHLVAGPGTHNVVIPGGSNAVHPAWRKAYTHIVAVRAWLPLNITQKNAVTRLVREEIVPTLRKLAPNSGAYINEADPTSLDWKNDYFGANYPRLLSIKKRWDPDGVFWCKPCVGHDEWDVLEGPSLEDPENWGVAQVGGKICKKS